MTPKELLNLDRSSVSTPLKGIFYASATTKQAIYMKK